MLPMLTVREIKKCLRLLMLHRLRSFLSTLGILCGVAAMIAMLAIGEGARQETLEQIEQLGMNSMIIRDYSMSEEHRAQAAESKSRGLTMSDADALAKNLPMLASYVPIKTVEAALIGAHVQISPEILATNRFFGEVKGLQLSEGRFLCDMDQKGKNLVCVLGSEVARELGKEGHIGHALRLGEKAFEIVGVLKSIKWKGSRNSFNATRNLDKTILIPLGSEQGTGNFLRGDADRLSEIILQLQPMQNMSEASMLTKKVLDAGHGGYEDYQIVVPQELLRQANRTQQTFNLVLGGIAAISLLVGGIGIMNIMLATISERTREIGIRRAVGASTRHILHQFLLETLLLTLVGACLGVLLGVGFSMLISWIAGWRMIVTFWSIVLSLVMAVFVGIFSGLYPAYQAARMDPILALRSN